MAIDKTKDIKVGGTLHSIATGNIIAHADEIMDENWGKNQSAINLEIKKNITNIADEEDLTLTSENKLQLKDRDSSKGMGYKILRLPEDGILTLEMINEPNTIYEIRYDFDLNGLKIIIPESCTLKFEGGRLNNGTIQLLDTEIYGITRESIRVVLGGALKTKYLAYDLGSPSLNSAALSSATCGIEVKEDLICNSIHLNSSIIGNGHRITFSDTVEVGIYIELDHITIDNIELVKVLPKTDNLNKKRAIYSLGHSNLSLLNSTVIGSLWIVNDQNGEVNTNILVNNCRIQCDFSDLDQNQENLNDILTLRGIGGASIQNNIIVAKNITRVFKLTGTTIDSQADYINGPFQIRIENNVITSTSSNGKLVFDMFMGSNSIKIIGNYIKAVGHTRIFEDKSYVVDKYHIDSSIYIADNYLESDSGLLLVNLPRNEKSILFENNNCIGMSANSPITIFNGNRVVIKGNKFLDPKGASTTSEPYILIREDWEGVKTEVERISIEHNDFECQSARPIYIRNSKVSTMTELNNTFFDVNSLFIANTAELTKIVALEVCNRDSNYYIYNNGTIKDLSLIIPQETAKRVILNSGSIEKILCNRPLNESYSQTIDNWRIIK